MRGKCIHILALPHINENAQQARRPDAKLRWAAVDVTSALGPELPPDASRCTVSQGSVSGPSPAWRRSGAVGHSGAPQIWRPDFAMSVPEELRREISRDRIVFRDRSLSRWHAESRRADARCAGPSQAHSCAKQTPADSAVLCAPANALRPHPHTSWRVYAQLGRPVETPLIYRRRPKKRNTK